jgi:hypothetical protein
MPRLRIDRSPASSERTPAALALGRRRRSRRGSSASFAANSDGPPAEKGQSMVEFVILLPVLFMLLLGVADFGRVFHAGVVTESASREAAEAAALEYLRTEDERPGPADPGFADYYQRIHQTASATACQESRTLPNATFSSGPPVACGTWPAIVVCVHDGLDPHCDATPLAGYSAGTGDCALMAESWSSALDPQGHPYVEVRLCYRFTTLFNLPAFGLELGTVHLEQRGTFTVADY